ncbi:MAG: PilN domain-containing protein, partial [Candidatus Binatia bacterium]
ASEVEAMRKKIKLIRDASSSENSSLKILTVLHMKIPSDIYLKSINFEDGSHLILKGVAKKMSGVFGFLATLEKQPNFHHVRTKHVTRSTRKGGNGEIDFEMTCLLAKNDEA